MRDEVTSIAFWIELTVSHNRCSSEDGCIVVIVDKKKKGSYCCLSGRASRQLPPPARHPKRGATRLI